MTHTGSNLTTLLLNRPPLHSSLDLLGLLPSAGLAGRRWAQRQATGRVEAATKTAGGGGLTDEAGCEQAHVGKVADQHEHLLAGGSNQSDGNIGGILRIQPCSLLAYASPAAGSQRSFDSLGSLPSAIFPTVQQPRLPSREHCTQVGGHTFRGEFSLGLPLFGQRSFRVVLLLHGSAMPEQKQMLKAPATADLAIQPLSHLGHSGGRHG
mmetsp:Transcript_52318/g.148147  ORF Transcript_52318/g.148147 Transcript_52318/m.148147 type:complete len:209 (+) Transcript_52318:138-764(+)